METILLSADISEFASFSCSDSVSGTLPISSSKERSLRVYSSTDLSFIRFIHSHYHVCRSVGDFAVLMNYSYSGFCKRFFRIFGLSAYKWMKLRRAERIYQEITTGEKPLKEIGYELGFNEASQFWRFCSDNLGATPAQIRKGVMKKYADSYQNR